MLWAERLVPKASVRAFTPLSCPVCHSVYFCRWNKFGKNLSKATKGWSSGFAEKFGQFRHLALSKFLQNPLLAAPPPYMRDDVEVWLGGDGVRTELTEFDGWGERIGSLWKGALGRLAAGAVMSTKITSHDTIVVGGVMFR
jgi:hypothetical protein